MTSPFGEQAPVLAKGERKSVGGREALLLALVLLLGLGLRALDWNEPWSGLPTDFRSAFGGGSTGGPARNFYSFGFGETNLVPIEWRAELEDGTRVYSYYPHHPTTCISITALSMLAFGPSEWASRLPWVLASMLALFGTWRLARLIWNPQVAITAALFTAVMPLAAHFASMQWIDGLVVAIYTALIYRYVLWMRGGAKRDLLWAMLYAFLGGLCEWSAVFLFPGLGLHALLVFGRRGQWRTLWSTALLPLGLLLGFAVHALHLRLALPIDHLARDTESTLAWVTSLPVPLSEFLALQWSFLSGYLTPPMAWLVVLATAALLARALLARKESRPNREEGVLLPLALSGILYVAVFPGRSYNHYFFVGLSVPFFGILAALTCLGLYHSACRARGPAATLFSTAGLLALGIFSAVLAGQRSADGKLSITEPETWLFAPLILARVVPWIALAGSLLAAIRGSKKIQATLALLCALSGALSFSAWDDIRFWSTRRSDRVGQLIQEPWMEALLEDPRAAILTTGNISMPLQFYSVAPVFIGIYSRDRLNEIKQRVLGKLGEGRAIAFLYETVALTKTAQAGRLSPEVVADLQDLRAYLGQISTPVPHGDLEVFDLTTWARTTPQ